MYIHIHIKTEIYFYVYTHVCINEYVYVCIYIKLIWICTKNVSVFKKKLYIKKSV